MDQYLEHLQADAEAGKPINWRQVREDMHGRHENATSSEERAVYISVWYAVMNLVVQSGIPKEDERAKFSETLNKDYNLFIVRESFKDGNVVPETLYEVTAREIDAGRMAPNHRLRLLAIFSINDLAALLNEYPKLYDDLSAGGGIESTPQLMTGFNK